MAQKISSSSQTVASTSLHLNRIPGTQVQITSTRYQSVAPLSDLNQRQLRFEVPQDIREFIDLSETRILVQCTIRDQDDKKITSDRHVGVINYLLGTLFKRVSVELNGVVISPSSELLPYVNYLKFICESSVEERRTSGGCSLYFEGKLE